MKTQEQTLELILAELKRANQNYEKMLKLLDKQSERPIFNKKILMEDDKGIHFKQD